VKIRVNPWLKKYPSDQVVPVDGPHYTFLVVFNHRQPGCPLIWSL